MTIRPSLSNTTIGYDWGSPQYRKGSIVEEHYRVVSVKLLNDSNKLIVYRLRRISSKRRIK